MNTNAPLQSPDKGQQKFFYGYVIVIAGFFVMFVMSGMLYTYGIFLKPIAEEFGWSRAVTSGAYSMAVFLFGLMFMLTGRLTDRFGPRLVVTVCGFILGLGYLLMSRVSAVWQLYLTYGVIIAAGQSGGLIPTTSTLARWFIKRRGLMTGLMITGIGIGQVVLAPLATHLIETYGWRTAYIVMGIIAWVLVITSAQFLKRDPGKMGQAPDGETSIGRQRSSIPQLTGYTRGEALRTRQLWLLFAAYIGDGVFVQGTMVHIVPHATDLGISPIIASSIVAIIGGASIVGRISMGILGDRTGNKMSLIIVFAVALASLLWLQIAREMWAFYIFAAIFGFAYGGLVVLESPATAEFFGLKSHGAVLGIVHFGSTIGGATSPLLTGRIFDITGSYRIAFALFAALGLLGLVLASLLKKTTRAF
ncbi:MAG: MFS transporter [Chloroflexi bacterium]|nr:MFS transporter [Chloroflexota bacterium]